MRFWEGESIAVGRHHVVVVVIGAVAVVLVVVAGVVLVVVGVVLVVVAGVVLVVVGVVLVVVGVVLVAVAVVDVVVIVLAAVVVLVVGVAVTDVVVVILVAVEGAPEGRLETNEERRGARSESVDEDRKALLMLQHRRTKTIGEKREEGMGTSSAGRLEENERKATKGVASEEEKRKRNADGWTTIRPPHRPSSTFCPL